MDTFNRFKQLMNGKLKQYPDSELKLMWSDWHCEHDLFKRTHKELGIKRSDRVRLVEAMETLGIRESINLSGINHRVYPEFYTNETAHLFAVKQNSIVKSKHFGRYY